MARAIQHGEEVSVNDIRAAVRADAASHYAQALKLGYDYLLAASDFFSGSIDREALNERLYIGKKGRDGIGV